MRRKWLAFRTVMPAWTRSQRCRSACTRVTFIASGARCRNGAVDNLLPQLARAFVGTAQPPKAANLYLTTDDTCRISSDDAPWWYIAHHDGAGRDDGFVSDRHARHQRRSTANEAAPPDTDRSGDPGFRILRIKQCLEGDERLRTYRDDPGKSGHHPARQRDAGAGIDVQSAHVTQP